METENDKAFTTLEQSAELTAQVLLAIKLDPAAATADPDKTIAEAKAASTVDGTSDHRGAERFAHMEPSGRLNAAPALSCAEVLRTITLNAAEQLKLAQVVGSVEVGKFADLIVLDKNFMQVPEDELGRNQVLMTLVGGKVVWATAPFVGQVAVIAGQ